MFRCLHVWQAKSQMNKIERVLREKAEGFHRLKLLQKGFSRFKRIHSKWNFSPEDKVEIEKMAIVDVQWRKKKRIFENWKYIVVNILKPERIINEKAKEFQELMLKRNAFYGLI